MINYKGKLQLNSHIITNVAIVAIVGHLLTQAMVLACFKLSQMIKH